MRLIRWSFLVFLAASTLGAISSPVTTNMAGIGNEPIPPPFALQRTPESPGFWKAYPDQLEDRGTSVGFNKLTSPSAQLDLIRQTDARGYKIREHFAHTGGKVFAQSMGDAFRETLVSEVLPIQEWTDTGDSVGRFFTGLLAGSIGNTAEEHADFISPSPTAEEGVVPKSWWRDARETGAIAWGLRLNPYAYATIGLGHSDIDKKPFYLESRLLPFKDIADYKHIGDIKEVRLEERLIIPIIDSVQLAFGYSLRPAELASGNKDYAASARIEWRPAKAIVFCGVRNNAKSTLLESGIFCTW